MSNICEGSIEEYNSIREFLNCFYRMENYFGKQSHRVAAYRSFRSEYGMLYAAVEKYIEKSMIDYKTSCFSDYKALNYLVIAILSRIQNINYGMDGYPIMDLDWNYSFFEEHIASYRIPLQEMRLRFYRKPYENSINALIPQAYVGLEPMRLQLADVYEKTNDMTVKLIKDIASATGKEIGRAKEAAGKQLPYYAIIGTLNLTLVALSFLGPMSAVASAAEGLIRGIGNAQGYMNDDEETAQSMIDSAQQLASTLNDMYVQERKILLEYLSNSNTDEIEKLPDVKEVIQQNKDFENIKNLINNLMKQLGDSSLSENVYWQEKYSIKAKLLEYQRQLSADQWKLKPEETAKNKAFIALIKWTLRVRKLITVAESGIKDYKQGETLISSVEDQNIISQTLSVNGTNEFEHNISMLLSPMIDTIRTDMTDVLRNSAHKSRIVFTESKRILEEVAQNFSLKISYVAKIDGKIDYPHSQSVVKLLDEMGTSLQIFGRIQNYKDKIRLADYLANLNFELIPNCVASLKNDTKILELQIIANLVLQEYQLALSMFKHYTYPFGENFKDQLNLTPFTTPVANFTNDLMNMANDRIRMLRLTSVNLTFAKPISGVQFGDNQAPSFFVWRHDTHGKKISKLLRGGEITINADIATIEKDHPLRSFFVIKFEEIGIRFLSANKTMENELRDVTVNFLVKMTHLGRSYYKCGDPISVIDHGFISISHSVNTQLRDGRAFYDHEDLNSIKIKNNTPTYSPFAVWKIQLENISGGANQREQNFKGLEVFQNQQFDLALEGRGSYYNTNVCNDINIKFYKVGKTSLKDNHLNPSGQYSRFVQKDSYDINSVPYDIDYASYDTNSVASIKSPINIAINWLTGAIGCCKSIWIFDGMNFNHVKNGFQSIYTTSTSSDVRPTADYASSADIVVNFNVYGSLTLADFLVRWLTKVKPYNNREVESTNSIEIRAFALNLVERVDNLIQFDLPDTTVQLDSLALASRLENELMINRNATAISNLICEAVANTNPNLNRSSIFIYRIRKRITEMLYYTGT